MSAPHAYLSDAAAGVAILLWAADPDRPALLATPFVHAAAAAALELPVEVYFTARSVHLLVPGVAARLRASEHFERSILETMREAVAHGARFYACTDALHAQGLDVHRLIPECTGHGGAVQFMARAGDLRWRALVF
jgi:predicted peroxiredoxin